MKAFSKIFCTSDLKPIDDYTIENEPISSLDLMERAAGIATDKLINIFINEKNFSVIAGMGNNGGDGYVMARLLVEKGYEVTLYALRVSDRFSPDCAVNRQRFLEMGGHCVEVYGPESFCLKPTGVIVDAIFGAGLNRPVSDWVGTVIDSINASGQPVVAIDMPSGLLGEDNGKNDGRIVEADYTLTFQFPKLALLFPENERYVGDFTVLDIGLHPGILNEHPSHYYYPDAETLASYLPVWRKFSHKGTLGHALLVAGSYNMMGAALLSAGAALRSGVGLLTIHVPRGLKELMHAVLPEALVKADRDENCFTAVPEVGVYDAIGIGPGLGTAPESAAGVRKLLEQWRGKIVLDADALNVLAGDSEGLSRIPEGAILTPHPKEFERLAGKSDNDFDRLNKLTTFARKYRVYVVLKGAHTTIAAPDGRCYFNGTGNPGMAKGGAGDVLTGIITALLANGMSPLDAAIVGVYVHGLAGDIACRRHGMRGMKSGDITDALGEAWMMMEQWRDK